MTDKLKIERFLQNEDAKEALKILVKIMKDTADIRTCKDEKQFFARQEALMIVDGWLEQVFNMKYQDMEDWKDDDYDELTKSI